MAKTRSLYFCLDCGTESVRWEGKCPGCGAWNTLAEAPVAGGGATPGPGRRTPADVRPVPLGAPDAPADRLTSGFAVVDRVLGGGLVPGSLVLLGGEPGIGKSTLMLQIAARAAAEGREVLYASGEESRAQVGLRARRVGSAAGAVPFVSTGRLEDVLAAAEANPPALLCIDSVQTVSVESGGAVGGPSQVRACAARAQEFAKRTDTAVVLVGHVTKDGSLAGPRTLEHIVDVVLQFEGRRSAEFRLLRSAKNRFGATDEVAAFRMASNGLEEVADPSALFLEDRPAEASGSAVTVAMHGSQPMLTEIQALTAPARYGAPQRRTTGYSARRLAILLAVLERRGGMSLADSDVFVNVVGGARLSDPASDLAVLAALASSHVDRSLDERSVWLGEVGLGGEVRGVGRPEARVRSAARVGLDRAVLPSVHREALGQRDGLTYVDHVRSVIQQLRDP